MDRQSLPSMSGFSRRTVLGSAAAVGVALGLGQFLRAAAQDATPAGSVPREGHPIIGVWQVHDPGNPNQGIAINAYDQGGAYVEFGIGWVDGVRPAVGIGAWRPTGERTVEVDLFEQSIFAREPFFDLDTPLPASPLEGNAFRIRAMAEVDDSGDRVAYTQHILDEKGENIPSTYTAVGAVRMLAVPTT